MSEGLKNQQPEQDQGSQFDHVFDMARKRHKDVEPHALPPEAVERLTVIMNEAIVAYEKYKGDGKLEDGQEALKLLEKYKQEFMTAKAEKEKLSTGVFREYEVDISKYKWVSGAIDVNGQVYMWASTEQGAFITGGNVVLSKHTPDYPTKYKGKVIYSSDGKIYDIEGGIIRDELPIDFDRFFVVDDSIYFLSKKNEDGNSFITNPDTKLSFSSTRKIRDLISINGRLCYISVGEDNESERVVDFADNILSDDNREIRSPIGFGDDMIYLATKDAFWWVVKDQSGNEISGKYLGVSSDLVSFGDSYVFAGKKPGEEWFLWGPDSKKLMSLGELEEVIKIEKIDETRGYVIWIKGNKLIKKVFDISKA